LYHQIFSNKHFIKVLILCFFVSESLTKFFFYSNYEFYRFGVYIKISFVCLYLFSHYKSKVLKVLFFFYLIHLLGLLFLKNESSLFLNIKSNLLYFSKYTFIFIIIDLFINYCNTKSAISKVIKLLFKILNFNFVLICIGLIANISYLKTYKYPFRFGFDGLFQMNSHASYIYIFASIFVFYEAIKHKTYSRNLIIIILSSMLVGTKAIYLFYALLTIYLLSHFRLWKSFMTFAVLGCSLIYLFRESVLVFVTKKAPLFMDLNDNFGLFTALTSTRNMLFEETFSKIVSHNYWSLPNFFFGGSYFNEIRTEFGFIDLYLFWGGIGGVCFLIYYYNKLFKYFTKNTFLKFSLYSLIVVVALAGNFFTNAVISVYVVSFCFYFKLEPS